MRHRPELGTIVVVGTLAALAIGIPQLVGTYQVFVYANFAIMAIFALSLDWVWGYGGILCFGQSAFFGLAAYVYAIAVINIGDSTLPFGLGIAVPAIFAAILGAVMFYGRVSDIYFAVITLCVTLILYALISSTAGPEFHIYAARLNGQNGISGFQPINVPGNPDRQLDPTETYYVAMAFLIACYVALRLILRSRFGRVAVSIRENPIRTSLLGYDTRWIRTCVLTIGAAIAGIAGVLFASWGTYVNPSVFGLQTAALVIMWVVVGGLGTMVGPIIGTIVLQYLANLLGKQQFANTGMIYGIVLIGFVLLVPQGVIPAVRQAVRHWRAHRSQRTPKSPSEQV